MGRIENDYRLVGPRSMKISAYKSCWKSSSRTHKKPWGNEVVWSTMSVGLHGKILNIQEGQTTRLKYYSIKNEALFVMSGKVTITYGNDGTVLSNEKYPYKQETLNPGDVFMIQAGCPYRIYDDESSSIVEIGDFLNDKGKKVNV